MILGFTACPNALSPKSRYNNIGGSKSDCMKLPRTDFENGFRQRQIANHGCLKLMITFRGRLFTVTCFFDAVLNSRTQGRIQSKFEGGAVGSGGAEKFSEIDDECTLYSRCREISQ